MSREELSPMVKEHLVRYEQLQQNMQTILVQKQQVELELAEVTKALNELAKVSPDDIVYKSAGSILFRVNRDDTLKELTEKKELNNTRMTVLAKQEARVKESARELQTKLDEMLRGRVQPPEA